MGDRNGVRVTLPIALVGVGDPRGKWEDRREIDEGVEPGPDTDRLVR
jgi:hypothetical protein